MKAPPYETGNMEYDLLDMFYYSMECMAGKK